MGDRDKELASLRGLVESLTGMKLPEPGQGGDALGEIDVLTDALARVERRQHDQADDIRTIVGRLSALEQPSDPEDYVDMPAMKAWCERLEDGCRRLRERVGDLEKRLPAPEVQPTTTDTFADPSYLNAMRAMWDSMDDPLAHAPATTVFPPTEADVTRAYERGIAEGRRQELRRGIDWLEQQEDVVEAASRNGSPGTLIGKLLALHEAKHDMKMRLRDANGEEVSNG